VLGLPKKRGHMNWLPRYPGTGKSLSLICSSLRWLHENPVHVDDEASGIGREEIDADLPQWVREHAIKEREKAREAALRREEERLERARQKLAQDKAERERERRSLKLGKGKSYKVARRSGAEEGAATGKSGDDAKLLLSEDEDSKEDATKQALRVIKELLEPDDDDPGVRDVGEEEIDVRKVLATQGDAQSGSQPNVSLLAPLVAGHLLLADAHAALTVHE